MNAERLHAIVLALRADLAATESPDLVPQLAQSLRQQVQDPAQPAHQVQVSQFRTQLEERLAQAPSNRFPPAWRQVVEEFGVADLLGEALRDRIRAIFERNEITPSAAADELAAIAEKLQALRTALDQLIAGLDFFGTGAEELAPGEFEVGFLIPRDAVGNELEELGKEFVGLKKILGPFMELTIGSRPDLEVRSISTSWFQVFLESPQGTALCLAAAVERIVALYKSLLDIRLAQQQLKDAGVPDEKTEGIKEHATGHMAAGIAQLADELLAEFGQNVEPDRVNELRVELKLSLNKIANRIDRGYNVDVRAGELPPEDEEALDDAEAAATRHAAEAIAAKQQALQFMNLTGRPILELPEGDENDHADADPMEDNPEAGDPE